MWKWLSVTNQEAQHWLLKLKPQMQQQELLQKTERAAIGKEKQKVAAQSEMENGKFSYLLAYLGHVASRQHFQVRS